MSSVKLQKSTIAVINQFFKSIPRDLKPLADKTPASFFRFLQLFDDLFDPSGRN
jgi:hypothetical protein